jgi:recombination protein RecT
MSNTALAKKPTFTMAISTEGCKKLINQTFNDPARAQQFVAALTSVVVTNPALEECEYKSILQAAFLGESLKLPPSPQLGYYYLLPFENKLKDANGKTIYQRDEYGNVLKDDNGKWLAVTKKKAAFVLGYKGYIQLALRSGQYADIDVFTIKQGEILGIDAFTGKTKLKFISNYSERETAPVVGYYAYLEYLNGFKKAIYWEKEKMIAHADKYAPAFSRDAVTTKKFSKVSFGDYEAGKFPPEDEWKYSSYWYQNFDGMAEKTTLRQLISKWGIMSVEMQKAFVSDGAVIAENGTPEFLSADDLDENLIAGTKGNDELPFENEAPPQEEAANDSDLYEGTPFAENAGNISMDEL